MATATPPKTKPVRVAGMTYRMEVPSLVPAHDAMFYISCAGGPHAPLVSRYVSKPDVLSRFHPLWGNDSPFRKKVSMPVELPGWEHEILTVTAEEYRPFYSDVRIRPDRIEWLPDLFRGSKWTVSRRFRDLVEEIDPGWHHFFPMKLLSSADDSVISDDYFSWLPRRRFTYRPKEKLGPDRMVFLGLMNPALSHEELWELTHNPAARDFFQTIPIWGAHISFDSVVYSAPTFRRLKAAGIVGLVEHNPDDEMLENPMAQIGCLF